MSFIQYYSMQKSSASTLARLERLSDETTPHQVISNETLETQGKNNIWKPYLAQPPSDISHTWMKNVELNALLLFTLLGSKEKPS
jgi:hypothetical protein